MSFPDEDHPSPDAEPWPPVRPCTECSVRYASTPLEQRPPSTPARWVITHLGGMQWYACDKHKLPKKAVLTDDPGNCRAIPIEEWWERIEAEDAGARLNGTWRPK